MSVLEKYALGPLGPKLVTDIQTPELLLLLKSIWYEKWDTARRLQSYLHAIMARAVILGYRPGNPLDALKGYLPSQKGKRKHHPALHHVHVAAALGVVGGSPRAGVGALVYEFLALTAVRSRVARFALWSEMDLDRKVWIIPRSKLKSKDAARPDFVVPLSDPALSVLERARELDVGNGVVFPSHRAREPLSDCAVSKLARENQIPAVPHGFRASFRGWCFQHRVEDAVAWACLDHQSLTEHQKAYLRIEHLPDRRDRGHGRLGSVRLRRSLFRVTRSRRAFASWDRSRRSSRRRRRRPRPLPVR